MSSTIVGLLILAFVLFVFVMVVLAIRRDSVCYGSCGCGGGCDVEDEVVTTHSTTTVTEVCSGHEVNGYHCEGYLPRVYENGQVFVVDPVDGEKVAVANGDDLYQDAGNKIWQLS